MSPRELIGVLIAGVGAIVFPFGHWVAVVFYPVGVGLLLLGCLLVFAGRRARKRGFAGYSDPNDPGFPVVGQARGFHGGAFRESHGTSADDETE